MPRFDVQRCFACGRPLKALHEADTRDDQVVFVGPECMKRIERAGEAGYRPASWKQGGALRLYPMPKTH